MGDQMSGWLRFMGSVMFLFLAFDATARIHLVLGQVNNADRLGPAAQEAANSLLRQSIGYSVGQVITGLTAMAVCFGIAAVLNRLSEK